MVEPWLEERERLEAGWQALGMARELDRRNRADWQQLWKKREAEHWRRLDDMDKFVSDGWAELLEARREVEEARRRLEEERRVLRRAVRVVWGWLGWVRRLREWWWRWGWQSMLWAPSMAPPGPPRTFVAI